MNNITYKYFRRKSVVSKYEYAKNSSERLIENPFKLVKFTNNVLDIIKIDKN